MTGIRIASVPPGQVNAISAAHLFGISSNFSLFVLLAAQRVLISFERPLLKLDVTYFAVRHNQQYNTMLCLLEAVFHWVIMPLDMRGGYAYVKNPDSQKHISR
jgi:hypothetical protein